VGEILRRTVREADVACRFGGEEFAVVLPETTRLGGYAVAERIRQGVERCFAEEPLGGHPIAMTVSCGLSCYPDDGLHASEIVSRADEALYGAKRSGRNRVGVRYRDKRSAVRFPVRPELAEDGERRAMNLSRTGVLLATDAAVAPADELHVRLGGLSAAARVVRVERGPDANAPFQVGAAFEAPLPEEAVFARVSTHAPAKPRHRGLRR
jgi:two-component system cell cycle response regulator